LRIIAGQFRGRRLVAPKGLNVRPTSDRLREALFSIWTARVPGASVLDCYGGSGAIGLEAASRGADSVTIIEVDRMAAEMIRENAEMLGAGVDIRKGDFFAVAPILAASGAQYDLIYVDPPYATGDAAGTIRVLVELNLLAPGGVLAVEQARKMNEPEIPDGLDRIEKRVYGQTVLTFYEPS
jgi:16S rRNA (guanine966-N2)-methyltransferase